MKFSYKIGICLLTACLIHSAVAGVHAADTKFSGTLSTVQVAAFSDVKVTDWFYEDVSSLTELGVLNGYPDGSFQPEREISNAEFIKILVTSLWKREFITASASYPQLSVTDTDNTVVLDRGVSVTVSGFAAGEIENSSAETENSHAAYSQVLSSHWAANYIRYACERGIIDDITDDFDPDEPITRADMTRMMIFALGIEPARIDDPFTDISDMYASTAYNEYLLRGYLMADGSRTYQGAGFATRAEATAIAMRMIRYSADSYAYKRDTILENAAENYLNDEFELLDLFSVLNREFYTDFTFKTDISAYTWAYQYYLKANVIDLEHFYSAGLSATRDGQSYTIHFEYSKSIDELKRMRTESEEKAASVVAAIITDAMTDTEKVKAIHDYIVLNCAYDYDSYLGNDIPLESRIAYGALCNKKAVCQGYTAAFNMMCKLAGLHCVAVDGYAPNSSESHVWNMVLIDGVIYHVDTTHDDPVPDRKGQVSYRFYCLTDAEMTALGYVWDKSYSNLKYFY